ncbi:MAG: class I SAM-dependent methyltransferase [Solirubrobacterales bacterium]
MSARTSDWDAALYHRVSSFQEGWARKMLDERVPMAGDETVLDAGCGSGRVTTMLAERLPRGRVIGVDAAPSMIEHARESLGDAAILINADLVELTPALLREAAGVDSVDLVFSNATFHWIPDHEALFRRLHSVLRPGGRLVAQCGAEGNVQAFGDVVESVATDDPFARHLTGWDRPWNFSSREDAGRRLAAAGFDPIECWITEFDATPSDPRAFMRASGFAPIFERLPADLHDKFVDAVFARLAEPVVFHYVRLNIDAVRPD